MPVVNSSGSILCIEMDVEAQSLSTSLHVVTSNDKNIVLGIDFLLQNRVILDFDSGLIVINGQPSNLFIPATSLK